MAKPLRLKFAVAFANGALIVIFEHPMHGFIKALVEHANGQPTRAAVLLGGANAPLQALGSNYAEAVLDIAQWALERDAA